MTEREEAAVCRLIEGAGQIMAEAVRNEIDALNAALAAERQRVAELEADRERLRELVKTLAYAVHLNEKEWIASLTEIKKELDSGAEFLNPMLALSAKKALKSLRRDPGPDHMKILLEFGLEDDAAREAKG